MELLLRVAIGAGGGLLGGLVAGFIAAIVALAAKSLRNSILSARGRPGIKDAILPLAFLQLSALAGLLLGTILAIFFAPRVAVLIAALGPAGLLTVLSVVFSIVQAFED